MGRSRHVHVDMYGQVSELKANLDERYKNVFCIMQELLQNADDAGAGNFIIGELEHLSDQHPLGKTPGIFVINDGTVTQSDLDQIFSIAASNKNDDNIKIGKFGLGMKSILHICETFFVFAHLKDSREAVDFFDPWDPGSDEEMEKMPDPHPDWRKQFEATKADLLKDAKIELGKYHDFKDSWLALWLPLRRLDHCRRSEALLEYYPGEERSKKWLTGDDCRKISGMFPFFRNLRKITFAAGWLKGFGTLEMIPKNGTAFKGNCLNERQVRNEWQGMIKSDRGIHNDLEYHGWEWINREMDKLRSEPGWPQVHYWDEEKKIRCRKADKTAPHAAICVCREKLSGSIGSMTLQQCVFLPLSDMIEHRELALPWNLTISFHGQFFIDAGRRSYKLEDHTESIKVRWNRKLLSELLLPKTLPALSTYFSGWNIEDVNVVNHTFRETDFWKRHRRDICQKYQYLLYLTKNGWKWDKFEKDQKFLKLPDAAHPDLPGEIYHRINKDRLLVRDDAEILTSESEQEWLPEQSVRIWMAVNTLPPEARFGQPVLDFMERFVSTQIKDHTRQTGEIKKFLSGLTLERYRESGDRIGRILRGYPHRNIAFAQNWTQTSFELWKKFLNLAVDCLPLEGPSDLPETSVFQYSAEDLKKIFPELEKELNARLDTPCKGVLRRLICDCFKNSEIKNWQESQFANFRLVETEDRIFSLQEVEGRRETIFANGGDVEALKQLQNAVSIKITRLNTDYSEALPAAGIDIKPFSLSAVKPLFDRSKPELKPARNRIDLLNTLLLSASGDELNMPIRYLLHGNRKYYDFEGNILIPDLPADDAIYQDGMALLRLLRAEKKQPDLQIDPELVNNLRPKDLTRLGIRKCAMSDLISQLAGLPEKQKSDLCERWRTEQTWLKLVSCLSWREDLDLCASLPIWPCRDGQFLALTECYLETDTAIPDCLPDIHILAVEEPREIKLLLDKYPRLSVWGDKDIVRYCTDLPDSQPAARVLCETVKVHKSVWPREMLNRLFRYPLLELQTGKRICFLQVMQHFDWQKSGLYPVNSLTGAARLVFDKLSGQGNRDPDEWCMFLCELLKDDPDFSFGKLPPEFCNAGLLNEIFSGQTGLMPVLDLLTELKEKNIVQDTFLTRLEGTNPTRDRLSRICTWLSRKWEERQNPHVMKLLQYFAGLAPHDFDWSETELPNSLNQSRKCRQMILFADGVDPKYILLQDFRRFFDSNQMPVAGPAAACSGKLTEEEIQQIVIMNYAGDKKAVFEQQRAECGKLLEAFFQKWPDELERPIGAFLRLLGGNNPDVLELAKRYDLDLDSEQLQNKISSEFRTAMQDRFLVVHVYLGTTHQMRPLAGDDLIEVPNQQDNEERASLLFGDESHQCQIDRRDFVYLALQPVDCLEKEHCESLLVNTIKAVVRKFKQPEDRVTALFDDFVKSAEQFDLKITKKLILKELPANLRRMGLNHDQTLKMLLDQWDSVFQKTEQALEMEDWSDLDVYEKQGKQILSELDSCFTDPAKTAVKQETLAAVKRIISTEVYGYDLNSVPFELFQNADDAAAELQLMQGILDRKPENCQPFLIELDDQALTVIHWGRPINLYKLPGFHPDKGRKMGFDKDLWRMLLIGVSEKNDSRLKRTGKFGLGFKSIFLLTDSPLICSNHFYFSIQGGLMPELASNDEKTKLKKLKESAKNAFLFDASDSSLNKMTVFHLPLRTGIAFDLEKFRHAAEQLVLFARKINAVNIKDHDRLYSFTEKEIGKKYLIWNFGDTIQLAMGKCNDLPVALPEKIATIWVTVPTSVVENFGFAVNGDFQLDVGRNHLFHCERNERIAQNAAGELEKLLMKEYRENQHPAQFWKNLWELFSNGKDSGLWKSLRSQDAVYQVLAGLIWGTDAQPAGYGKFIRENPVVPSRLPGKYDLLAALDQVKTVIRSDLGRNWELFSVFIDGQNWVPETVIAESVETDWNNIYGCGFVRADHCGIQELMRDYADQHPDLSPEILNRAHGWKAFFEQNGDSYRNDWPSWCSPFKFLNREGAYCPPKDLLIRNDNAEEESLRAAFAPDSAVLSSAYSLDSQIFFRRVRKEMLVSFADLVQWALAAESNRQKEAVFAYFEKGEKKTELIHEISKSAGSRKDWLDEWSQEHPDTLGADLYRRLTAPAPVGTNLPTQEPERPQRAKYSFGWFISCLEEEIKEQFPDDSGAKDFSICFAKVEQETKRILHLHHPNRNIPEYLEIQDDIPMQIYCGDRNKPVKTVMIDVASIKSYSICIKLKNEVDDIDWKSVTQASIKVISPDFLLKALKEQFEKLPFADNCSLKQQLSPDIEFVFGPPGTGKTTHLARNVLIPLMELPRDKKVLVLTPTNKAADVLVSKIMDFASPDSYLSWLVRFGTTQNEKIETSGVFKERSSFDIRSFPRNVTVTTVARFPYDTFQPKNCPTRLPLRDLQWDYVVIDEASMVPLAAIAYPLFKLKPEKFIIAGDPFQIEPITHYDEWAGENIYTMTGLNSFSENPPTEPYRYPVTLLKTQYRSVPVIGQIFSSFAYRGILSHDRKEGSGRPLPSKTLPLRTVNLVHFPCKNESIYQIKRLNDKSPYQMYSALFAFEFAKYLAEEYDAGGPGPEKGKYRIGIISPYRIQTDLIDKLLARTPIPDSVSIQAGTAHGFQGDECEMIIALFNPPPDTGRGSFVNRSNIINVAVSRARDCLFLMAPEFFSNDFDNLREVCRLCRESGACLEIGTHDLEEIMFGDRNFLENNSFSTGHQRVNVYSEPEKRYEIRSESSAVDIQLHMDDLQQ